jgi:hypothetical protein
VPLGAACAAPEGALVVVPPWPCRAPFNKPGSDSLSWAWAAETAKPKQHIAAHAKLIFPDTISRIAVRLPFFITRSNLVLSPADV